MGILFECIIKPYKTKGVWLMTDEQNLEVLSVEEAAAYLKFSTAYLYRLAKEKKIPHVNYGRHIIFRKIDLFNWLGEMTCPATESKGA